MSDPAVYRRQVLSKWFLRGMLSGNAMAMINRCVSELRERGILESAGEVKTWIKNEKVRLKASGNKSVLENFELALQWSKRNTNPSPWEDSQWFKQPKRSSTTSQRSIPRDIEPEGHTASQSPQSLPTRSSPPVPEMVDQPRQNASVFPSPPPTLTHENGAIVPIPRAPAPSSQLPDRVERNNHSQGFILPYMSPLGPAVAPPARPQAVKKRKRKSQLQLLIEAAETSHHSVAAHSGALILLSAEEPTDWGRRLRERKRVSYRMR